MFFTSLVVHLFRLPAYTPLHHRICFISLRFCLLFTAPSVLSPPSIALSLPSISLSFRIIVLPSPRPRASIFKASHFALAIALFPNTATSNLGLVPLPLSLQVIAYLPSHHTSTLRTSSASFVRIWKLPLNSIALV